MSELQKPVKHHRSREEAAQLVMEYQQSGLKPTAFCRIHGLSGSTLDNYRKRLSPAVDIVCADQNSTGAVLSKASQPSPDSVTVVSAEPVVVSRSASSTRAQATPVHSPSLGAVSRHATVNSERKLLSSSSAMKFVPVDVIDPHEVATSASMREICEHDATEATLIIQLCHGRRIGVLNGFNASTLTRLIAVLEEA